MHLDKWIEQLKSGMCISEMDLKRLCYHIKNLLIEEANVQPVRAPVTVSTIPPFPIGCSTEEAVQYCSLQNLVLTHIPTP